MDYIALLQILKDRYITFKDLIHSNKYYLFSFFIFSNGETLDILMKAENLNAYCGLYCCDCYRFTGVIFCFSLK